MKTYRRVGSYVRAEQLTNDNAEALARECHGQVIEEQDALDPEKVQLGVNVPTLDGNKRLGQGQFLVVTSGRPPKIVDADVFLSEFEESARG